MSGVFMSGDFLTGYPLSVVLKCIYASDVDFHMDGLMPLGYVTTCPVIRFQLKTCLTLQVVLCCEVIFVFYDLERR